MLDWYDQVLTAMNAKGLSQREVAARLGVHEVRVSNLLRSNANPTVKTLKALINAIDPELSITITKKS